MPIYEYQCPSCGNIFEEWVRTANDEEEKECPNCDGMAHRMISNTAFILKGGGWYVTDYGYRKGVSEDGKAGSGGGAVKPDDAAGSAGAEASSGADAGTAKSSEAAAPAAAPASASSPAASAAPSSPSAPASNIAATGS